MKHLIAAAALLSVLSLTAGEIPLKGDFAALQKDKYPVGWYNNTWGGYLPAPKFEIVKEKDFNAVHFTEINGKSGFGWSSKARPAAKAGDTVRVTAKVKGTGKAWFGLQSFTDKGRWIMVLPMTYYDLTPEWKEVKFDLPVEDRHKTLKTGIIMVTFGANSKADFYIGDLKGEVIPAAPAAAPAAPAAPAPAQ